MASIIEEEAEAEARELRKHTIMDDLIVNNEVQKLIPLKIQDKHRYFESLLSTSEKDVVAPTPSTAAAHASHQMVLLSYTPDDMLDSFRSDLTSILSLDKDDPFQLLHSALIPSDLASTIAGEIVNSITQSGESIARHNVQSLPQEFLSEFKTTYTHVNEILRHTWSVLGSTVRQWKEDPNVQAKAKRLITRLMEEYREKLIKFQETYPNHQTKQLTNALIESIQEANNVYKRRLEAGTQSGRSPVGVGVGPGAQRPGGPAGLGTPGSAGRPTLLTSSGTPPGVSPVTNKPTLSFSLTKRSPQQAMLTPPATKQQQQQQQMEDDDDDDVFGGEERPSKKARQE